MSTLNVSMPESMRDYIESRAEKGQYSASEYIRHLIREDQKQQHEAERNHLWDLLAISARQLDEGQYANTSADDVIARGRARRGVK